VVDGLNEENKIQQEDAETCGRLDKLVRTVRILSTGNERGTLFAGGIAIGGRIVSGVDVFMTPLSFRLAWATVEE